MTNTTIISLAILKLNWDVEDHKDYLDNFVLIVAECIRTIKSNVISIPEIREKLIEDFKLKIPHNSISSILRRVYKKGLIAKRSGYYYPIRSRLEKLNFRPLQQSVLQMHEALINHLIIFCTEQYQVTWNTQQAELALEKYLEEYDLLSLRETKKSEDNTVRSSTENISMMFLVGAFVRHLYDTHSSASNYLETIVEGNMLANALFLTKQGTVKKKFRNTKLYFDAPLLIYALGYAGNVRQAPSSELLDMLRNSGAELRCYSHTLNEARGILEACSYKIASGKLTETWGPSIEYFISKGFTSSDIMIRVNRLERDIKKIGFTIVETPDYSDYEFVIGETSFAESLRSGMRYRNEDALLRDVESVAAIMRERKGRQTYEIEESRAIFVTMNSTLFQISRDYCRQDEGVDGSCVPPCITDRTLTNLMWLKNPIEAPDLPRKRIVADYYAAIQPSDNLWQGYIAEVEKLSSSGDVTEEDYFILRSSLEAKRALMDSTLGSTNAFAQGTVPEILKMAKSKMQQSLKDKLADEIKEKEIAQKKSDTLMAKIELTNQIQKRKIKNRAQKYALWIANIIQGLILFLLCVGMWTTFPWNFPKVGYKFFFFLLQLFLFIFSVLNLYFGITIKAYIRKFEDWLSNKIEENLSDILRIETENNISYRQIK